MRPTIQSSVFLNLEFNSYLPVGQQQIAEKSENTKLNQYIGRRSNQICLSFSYFEMHYHVFLIDLLEIDKLKLHYYYLCTRLPIWLLEKRDKD